MLASLSQQHQDSSLALMALNCNGTATQSASTAPLKGLKTFSSGIPSLFIMQRLFLLTPPQPIHS